MHHIHDDECSGLVGGVPLGRAMALGTRPPSGESGSPRLSCWGCGTFLDDSVVSDKHRCELGVLFGNAFPNELSVRTAISIMGLPHRGSWSRPSNTSDGFMDMGRARHHWEPSTSPGCSANLNSTTGSKTAGVELILEMGILGPILWLIWSGSLLYSAWKIVRHLTRNRLFPRGFFDFLVCVSSPDSLYVWRLAALSELRHERLFLGANWCSLPLAPSGSHADSGTLRKRRADASRVCSPMLGGNNRCAGSPGWSRRPPRNPSALRPNGWLRPCIIAVQIATAVASLGECLLVNARLAIVDLSERGRQPMSNAAGTVWITYNGEAYNAAELREQLIARGHKFRSTTDTEVVLQLYEEYGDFASKPSAGCLRSRFGMPGHSKLLLARDRLGIKPLYVARSGEQLIFGSELKTLLASGLIERRLDPASLRIYLQLGHVPPPWTIVQGVQPLEPGTRGHMAGWRMDHSQLLESQTLRIVAEPPCAKTHLPANSAMYCSMP